jgi:hypothetical protein
LPAAEATAVPRVAQAAVLLGADENDHKLWINQTAR